MSAKSDISFLLNPQSSGDLSLKITTPASPPASFQRLMAIAQSPDAVATSSLLMLGSCIAPLEKVSASKKTAITPLSLAALCEASSASSYSSSSSASSCGSDDEAPEEEPKVVEEKAMPPATKPKPKAKTTRKRDEIERLKEEHIRKLKEVEEAASAKLAEQARNADALTAANSKLKNDMITMDVASRDARDRLRHERQTWNGERIQLQATIAEATKTQPPASPSRVKRNQPQTEVMIEEEKSNQRLEAELELSRQACTNADAARRSAEMRLVEVKNDFERLSKENAAQREQIAALQAQLDATRAQQKSLTQELKSIRERNRSLESKSPKERPSSTASTKLQLQQKTLLAQLQDTEERYAKLEIDHRALQSQWAKLQQQLANEIAQRRADAAEAGIFAIHVELKRENFQLRAQVEELKALQKRFLTSAKKKTMSFPSL
ncbi:unnamed protein product [Phytophthora lilii]|uniref:Unnamed protein product n=1 Tax=Phytophthora lilii TaxID=2077276 RepID=A0A9W6U6Q5_9STRA|nr:unnamed protein product [Phytophthora lilii]